MYTCIMCMCHYNYEEREPEALRRNHVHLHVHVGPNQLSCLGSSVGRALCLEYRVRVVGSSPTRGSSFFLGRVTALGVLCCFALFVCLTLLVSFFLPSHLSFKNTCTYNIQQMYMYMYSALSRV